MGVGIALRKMECVAVEGGKLEELRTSDSARKALVLGFVLCLMQALDGILTSLGMLRFGVAMEGNPLLRFLMQEYGQAMGLGVSKAMAIAAVVALVALARSLPWVNKALGALGAFYFFMAIVPWTYILFIGPHLI